MGGYTKTFVLIKEQQVDFSPSILWVPRTKLGSPGLSKQLYRLCHLAHCYLFVYVYQSFD